MVKVLFLMLLLVVLNLALLWSELQNLASVDHQPQQH